MQLNPARGRKQMLWVLTVGNKTQGLCSSTPRGDGNPYVAMTIATPLVSRFMQLNPARGRKRFLSSKLTNTCDGVYAAQPREGTETEDLYKGSEAYEGHGLCSSTPRGDGNLRQSITNGIHAGTEGFMQLNPARGRKLDKPSRSSHYHIVMVYAAQPREGTETCA